MADQARRRRVEERIQTTVARLLERRVKDPRIGFTTITDCRVTGDLQHATVFYTVFGDEKQREKTAKALNSAKGLIRSEVGKALGIRLTPSIEFTLDALPQQTASFEETLASALDSDVICVKGLRQLVMPGRKILTVSLGKRKSLNLKKQSLLSLNGLVKMVLLIPIVFQTRIILKVWTLLVTAKCEVVS